MKFILMYIKDQFLFEKIVKLLYIEKFIKYNEKNIFI